MALSAEEKLEVGVIAIEILAVALSDSDLPAERIDQWVREIRTRVQQRIQERRQRNKQVGD